MQAYRIILKNEKNRLYRRITMNAILINILLLIIFCFTSLSHKQDIITVAVCIALVIPFFLLYKKIQASATRLQVVYALLFLLFAACWALLRTYPAIFANLIFGILSVIAVRHFIVYFYEQEVHYPSFPVKKIAWGQLNGIILKDGLLTIDFKNNKLIQQYIRDDNPIDEKEFNTFCKSRLNA